MRILLLGATGQLARDLGRRLIRHDVIACSHQELDIEDKQALADCVAHLRPECIINTAAYHRVDDCETHPDRAFAVNAVGADNLARTASQNNSVLVHFSTDYVFDGSKSSPYTEADRPNPLSVYGHSKRGGERLIEQYCEKHFIIRTCGLYGAAGSASKNGNFVRSILQAAQTRRPLRVVTDQIVTPTSTSDLAEKVSELLEHNAYGTYHMTNIGECSWFDFAREILRLRGLPVEVEAVSTEEFGSAARRPRYSVLDNSRMRALGIQEFRPWHEALADFLVNAGQMESAA